MTKLTAALFLAGALIASPAYSQASGPDTGQIGDDNGQGDANGDNGQGNNCQGNSCGGGSGNGGGSGGSGGFVGVIGGVIGGSGGSEENSYDDRLGQVGICYKVDISKRGPVVWRIDLPKCPKNYSVKRPIDEGFAS